MTTKLCESCGHSHLSIEWRMERGKEVGHPIKTIRCRRDVCPCKKFEEEKYCACKCHLPCLVCLENHKKPKKQPDVCDNPKCRNCKIIGCGKEMYLDDNPDSNIHWPCGTEIKGEIDLCEDCKKPKNHSPQKSSFSSGAKDTPSGDTVVSHVSEGTFNLSEKRSHLARGVFYHEIYVKTFIKNREEDLMKVMVGDMDITIALHNLRKEAGDKLR